MTSLAITIYKHLRKRLIAGKSSITYAELASAVGDLAPRDPNLYAALGEIANACRHGGLPCLPAIVWRTDTRRPSTGYYKVAHPRAHSDESRRSAWEREHARVVRDAARFPLRLA